MKHQISYL